MSNLLERTQTTRYDSERTAQRMYHMDQQAEHAAVAPATVGSLPECAIGGGTAVQSRELTSAAMCRASKQRGCALIETELIGRSQDDTQGKRHSPAWHECSRPAKMHRGCVASRALISWIPLRFSEL